MVGTKLVAIVGIGAALMALSGCASGGDLPPEPTVATLTLDASDWSDAQLGSIYRAADRWNTLAHKDVLRIEAVEGARKMQHIMPATLPEHFSGMHSPSLATIRIDLKQADDVFETVVVHELGHALGLGHIAEPGIMDDVVDGSVIEFTAGDRAECTRAGWCPPHESR